jgi:phosphatidylethanolamine/phosphatidyl-N-methylethanolamine N-methyltransferase
VTHEMKDPHQITKEFYDKYYEKTFNSGGLNGWGYRKTHKDLERHVPLSGKILEIGAGSAQHLMYVEQEFLEYVMVDLTAKPHEFDDKRLQWIQGNIENSQFKPNYFDRILSMCVFHHLDNPAKVMNLIDIWLKPGGTFSLFLPMDPSFANRLNRKLFVLPRTRKLGFKDYEIVNALEHRNHFWGLKSMLNYYFQHYDKKVVYRPFGKLMPLGNLYSIWQLRKPTP